MKIPGIAEQMAKLSKLGILNAEAIDNGWVTESEALMTTSLHRLTLAMLTLAQILEPDLEEAFSEWRRQELEKSNQGVPSANGLE